jgi:hypothetical protein
MLAGEKWLSPQANAINTYNVSTKPTVDTPFHVQVIKCKNYDHNSKYILPVFPSPNIKSMQAIYLYPSTCLIEGTVLSEGRGTDAPFQKFWASNTTREFIQFHTRPNAGAKSSKCFYQKCYGWYISGTNEEILKQLNNRIQLKYLVDAYKLFQARIVSF